MSFSNGGLIAPQFSKHCHFSKLISKYRLPVIHSSCTPCSTAVINLSQDATFGNSVATLVRLLISLFSLSNPLTVRIFFLCASGKLKHVNPSSILFSSHFTNSGAELLYFSIHFRFSSWAVS